jgi:hypothetical protein
MKSDSDIKRDAEAELKWDPHIDAIDIAVAVTGGVVILISFVLMLITHRARHDFPRRSQGRRQSCSPNLKGEPRNWAAF